MAGFLLQAALSALFMASVYLGLHWAQWGNASPIWPATGVGLALVFYLGPRVWPALLLGAVVGELAMHSGIAGALTSSLAGVLEALLIWWIYHRLCTTVPLTDIRSTLAFFLSIVVGTLASALVRTTLLSVLGEIQNGAYDEVLLTLWLADLAGGLLVGATLLAWWPGAGRGEWRGHPVEYAALLLANLGAGYVVFSANSLGNASYPVDFLPLPILFWTALRFGLRGVSLALLAFLSWAVVASGSGHGLFGRWLDIRSYWLLLAYVLFGSTPMLALSAMSREQEVQNRALQRARDLFGSDMLRRKSSRDGAREQLSEHLTHLDTALRDAPISIWAVNRYGRVTLSRGPGLKNFVLSGAADGQTANHLFAGEAEFLAHVQAVLGGQDKVESLRLGGHLWLAQGKPKLDAKGKPDGAFGILVMAWQPAVRSETSGRDRLTGLLDRHEFQSRLSAAIERAKAEQKRLLLLRLDFAGLADINTRYGYAMGDEILAELALRLETLFQGQGLVARLAGDEMAILIEGRFTQHQAELAAEKVNACCAPPYQEVVQESLNSRIGIALFPDHGVDEEALLENALAALAIAKPPLPMGVGG
jgi:diguanylate cyclase (GGDEF)-like protein